jgi:hypothetical protein
MKENEVRALFQLAGFKVLGVKALIDGYGYDPTDPRYFQTLPYQVWWFVKTAHGWIEIGWRKRVIQIDWRDTPLRLIITDDDVTKATDMVHAWSIVKALQYLAALHEAMASATSSDARFTDVEPGKATGSALNLSSSVPSGRSPR